MDQLNEGKALLDQVLYPIGPNIEFGKKMVKDIPS